MGIAYELRQKAGKLIEFGKYAVDSAVSDSLLAATGKLKDRNPSSLSNDTKKQNSVLAEEMQAKLEKLRQGMNNLEQSNISTCENQNHVFKQFCDEPLQIPPHHKAVQKKIFIHSRL